VWSIGALGGALAIGIYGYEAESAFVAGLARTVLPLGSVWLNALQMTVIPLVVAQLLVAIVGRGGASAVGRVGLRAIALFLPLLFVSGIAAAVLALPLLGLYRVPADIVASVRASVVVPAAAQQVAVDAGASPLDWLVGLVPSNVFAAAADGQVLPLLLFAAAFGAAATHLPGDARETLGRAIGVVADVMLQLVRWVLWATPAGVFALVIGVAFDAGGRMVGVLGAYLAVSIAVLLILTALIYPAAELFGRTTIGRFARAVAPAQLIGLSTRSSLAALPAHVESGRRHLDYSDTTAGFTVPLCVTTFKITTPISAMAKALFIAHLFAITLGPAQIVMFTVAMVAISFSVLGVPRGGAPARGLPAYLAIGLPIEGYFLVEAVDDIVDFAQTLNNVTGHAGAAVLLSRGDRVEAAVAAEPARSPLPGAPA
jgi:Na+/H+-dicarboxylate symporter